MKIFLYNGDHFGSIDHNGASEVSKFTEKDQQYYFMLSCIRLLNGLELMGHLGMLCYSFLMSLLYSIIDHFQPMWAQRVIISEYWKKGKRCNQKMWSYLVTSVLLSVLKTSYNHCLHLHQLEMVNYSYGLCILPFIDGATATSSWNNLLLQ